MNWYGNTQFPFNKSRSPGKLNIDEHNLKQWNERETLNIKLDAEVLQ